MSADTRIFEVHEEVKKELQTIPSVRSVGIGLKEVSGQLTNQIVFKVYVDQKKPLSELTPEEIIPTEIKGFQTDVITLAQKTLLTHAGPLPLVGGIAASSVQPSGDQEHGTLGCIAKIKGSPNKVLVGNEHVFKHGSNLGGSNNVFQPKHSDCLGVVCNEVGSTAKGKEGNISFNNGTITADFFVDCAIATPNSDIGTRNKIFGIGVVNGSTDISSLVINDATAFQVKKRGATTALTVGVVEDIAFDDPVNDPEPRRFRQIVIRPSPGFAFDKTFRVKAADKATIIDAFATYPVTVTDVGGDKLRFQTNTFALPGDSGSALLNNSDAVVGLVFAMESITITTLKGQKEKEERIPLGKGVACHIGPVMQEMNIEIQSGANPSSGAVQPRIERLRRREPRPDDGDINRAVRDVEEVLRNSPNGEWVFGVLERHFPELAHLVHHRRPVMVVWNRSKGPGFANSFLRSLRYPDQPIRKEIDGTSLHTFLNRMYDVLIREGSEEFGKEVARLRALVSRLAEYENMTQVIDHFKNRLITLPVSGSLLIQAQSIFDALRARCLTIQSGSAIANSKGVPGTLGCFAHADEPRKNAILSSYHVLFGHGAEKNQEISFIQPMNDSPIPIAIGRTITGKLGTVSFEGDEYYVDCALSTISNRWWTRNKCSLGDVQISGFGRAQVGSRVKKLGSASGLTEGIIADIHYPDEAYIGGQVLDAPNQILIKPALSQLNGTCANAFSLPGDSGAVLLDEENKIVGLLWGSNSKGEGIACHIGPVLQELGLKSVIGKMIFLKRVFSSE